jgi:xanthine dehydrogenase iron-sulfur cluster and FAD-binding subunit A
MAMLWSSEVLHLTEALTNFLEVVARFPESVVVAGLTGLPVTGGKTAAMVATMTVVVRIAELGLNLVVSSRISAARNSGEIGLALRM